MDPEEVTKLEMADDIDEDQEKINLALVDQKTQRDLFRKKYGIRMSKKFLFYLESLDLLLLVPRSQPLG